MKRLYLAIVFLAVTQVVMPQVPVMLVAGQSNTDGRVDSSVDYVLSWKDDGIGVSLTVDTPRDTMRLSYGSDAGGQTDQMTWLQDFQILQGKMMVDSVERVLTVIPDGGKAQLSYVVRYTLPKDASVMHSIWQVWWRRLLASPMRGA